MATRSLGLTAALGGIGALADQLSVASAPTKPRQHNESTSPQIPTFAESTLTEVPDTLPPLETITFLPGSIVVPFDDKQADRTAVFGFIHALLRNRAELLRIIEPPVVTLVTALNPSGAVYDGGVMLVDPQFASIISTVKSYPDFANVTTTTLTTSFTSNAVFRVRVPTKILVIRGIWGRTELTLAEMKFPQHKPEQGPFDPVRDAFDVIEREKIEADPSIIDNYTLIVVDCPGWFGNPPGSNTPDQQATINAIYAKIKARAEKGNEVIFTDIAIRDMDRIWPGKLNLETIVGNQSIQATFHNPSIGNSFVPEFPSQYWNPPPDPNTIRILAPGSGTFVTSVTDASKPEVRVVIDTEEMNIPRRHGILGFYFEVGSGLAEGLALHPQEQTAPNADEKGHFAIFQIYGNKFVHGIPPPGFILTCPPGATLQQTRTINVTISLRSFNAFSSPVSLTVTGLPPGVTASLNPPAPVPPPNGIGTSVLTLTAASNAPTGTFTIRINAVNNDNPAVPLSASCDFTLEIQLAPVDFQVGVAPPLVVVEAGKSGDTVATVSSQGLFNSPVNLSLSGLPANTSASFAPTQVTPPAGGNANSVLTISTQTNAVAGDYPLLVTGTSAGPQLPSQQRSAPLTLRITPAPTPPLLLPIVIVLLLGLLSLGLGILAARLARRGPGAVAAARVRPGPPAGIFPPVPLRPRAIWARVAPVPKVFCMRCRHVIPANVAYCPFCRAPRIPFGPRPPPVMVPGPPLVGAPPVPRPVAGFVLALVAGILIILNAAALLSTTFWNFWITLFFWLPSIGQTFGFLLGMLFGLVVVVGSIWIIMRHGVLGAISVIPFSVLSILIGGGFVAGAVLGVVAGILAAAGR